MTILLVAGTRPEIIKLAPVYAEMRRRRLDPVWAYSGQSPDLASETFKVFGMEPEISMELARETGDLGELHTLLSARLDHCFRTMKPRMVIVQGDTLTAAVGAQMAFLSGIPTAHVEAGLRSWDIDSPYPEEACRIWIDAVATLKFAPTQRASATLSGNVYVTGNTAMDALKMVSTANKREGRYAVVTLHRRENAKDVSAVCEAIKQLADHRVFDYIVWPVHPNPAVRDVVPNKMKNVRNVECIKPLPYDEMVALVKGSKMLLTDSGGLQEEALGLGVPCLVLRKETERPEGVQAGGARIVGTDRTKIASWATWLMENQDDYDAMATAPNPYGDGKAAARITTAIKAYLEGWKAEESKTNWIPPRLMSA